MDGPTVHRMLIHGSLLKLHPKLKAELYSTRVLIITLYNPYNPFYSPVRNPVHSPVQSPAFVVSVILNSRHMPTLLWVWQPMTIEDSTDRLIQGPMHACRLTWLHDENTPLMLQVHLTYWDGNYFAGWSSIWPNGLLRSEGVVVGEQRVRSAMTIKCNSCIPG